MLSVPTAGYVCCQCCNVVFQRLSSHLSWNECCGTFYKSMPLGMGNGVIDDVHRPDVAYVNKEGGTTAAQESTRNSRCTSPVDQPTIHDDNCGHLHYCYCYQYHISNGVQHHCHDRHCHSFHFPSCRSSDPHFPPNLLKHRMHIATATFALMSQGFTSSLDKPAFTSTL